MPSLKEIELKINSIENEIDLLQRDIVNIKEGIKRVGDVKGNKIDQSICYEVSDLNFIIQELIQPQQDVKFIELLADNIDLTEKINGFRDDAFSKKLIIPIRPLHPKSSRESKEFSADGSKDKIREHFTGIYIEKDGIGGYKASYFDPTGLGEVNEIPSKTLSSITTSLGIQESDIVPTKTVFQYSERRLGEKPSFANNSCGAFVAQVLSHLALDNIKISDVDRSILRSLNGDDYEDLLGWNDNQSSNEIGNYIRDNHKQILSILLQEKEQEVILKQKTVELLNEEIPLQSNAETLFIEIDNDFKKNVNKALFDLIAYEENELTEDQEKEKKFDLAKRLLLVAAERNLSQVIATLFEAFQLQNINTNSLLNHSDQFGNIFFPDLIEKAKNEFGIELLDVLRGNLLGMDSSSGTKGTALQIAAAKNNDDATPNHELVKALINAGANLNPLVLDDREEMTVLDIAVARRDVEMVRKICDSVRSNISFDKQDSYLNKSLQYLDMDFVKVAKAIKKINPNFKFTEEEKRSFEENGSEIREIISGKKTSAEVDDKFEIDELKSVKRFSKLSDKIKKSVKNTSFDLEAFQSQLTEILSLEFSDKYTLRSPRNKDIGPDQLKINFIRDILETAAAKNKSEVIEPLFEVVEAQRIKKESIINEEIKPLVFNPDTTFIRLMKTANNAFALKLLEVVGDLVDEDQKGIALINVAAKKDEAATPNHLLVKGLIDAGANPNITSKKVTALDIAVARRDAAMVEAICNSDKINQTTLKTACDYLNQNNDNNLLQSFTGNSSAEAQDNEEIKEKIKKIIKSKMEGIKTPNQYDENDKNSDMSSDLIESSDTEDSITSNSSHSDDSYYEEKESIISNKVNDEEEKTSSGASYNVLDIPDDTGEDHLGDDNYTEGKAKYDDSTKLHSEAQNTDDYLRQYIVSTDKITGKTETLADLLSNNKTKYNADIVRDDQHGDTLKNIIKGLVGKKKEKPIEKIDSFAALQKDRSEVIKTGKLWYEKFSKVDFVEKVTGEKVFGNVEIFMANFNNCTFTNVDFTKVKFFENAGFYKCKFKGCTFSEEQKKFLENYDKKYREKDTSAPSKAWSEEDFVIEKLSSSPKKYVTKARVQPLNPVKNTEISN